MSVGAVSATGAAGAVGTVGLRGAMILPSLVDVTSDTKPSVILGQITLDSPCDFFFWRCVQQLSPSYLTIFFYNLLRENTMFREDTKKSKVDQTQMVTGFER